MKYFIKELFQKLYLTGEQLWAHTAQSGLCPGMIHLSFKASVM